MSSNRLAQLQDDLVAAFAHDVRSPLAAILGYASMLQEETESGNVPANLVPTLRRIEANALHVEDMIAEMLTVEHSDAAPNNVVSTFSAESLLGLLQGEFEPIARSQRREVSWLVDPGLRLVEVYQTVNGLPALVTTAQDDERRVLPPFELEISFDGWWLPGPPPTE
jgi:signal transduction histidine kinase